MKSFNTGGQTIKNKTKYISLYSGQKNLTFKTGECIQNDEEFMYLDMTINCEKSLNRHIILSIKKFRCLITSKLYPRN